MCKLLHSTVFLKIDTPDSQNDASCSNPFSFLKSNLYNLKNISVMPFASSGWLWLWCEKKKDRKKEGKKERRYIRCKILLCYFHDHGISVQVCTPVPVETTPVWPPARTFWQIVRVNKLQGPLLSAPLNSVNKHAAGEVRLRRLPLFILSTHPG